MQINPPFVASARCTIQFMHKRNDKIAVACRVSLSYENSAVYGCMLYNIYIIVAYVTTYGSTVDYI